MHMGKQNIFIGLLAAIICTGLFLMLSHDTSHLRLLVTERLSEKESVFDELRSIKSGAIEKMLVDNSYWDDLIKYLTTRDERWIADNLDSSFATFSHQYIWIYRQDGALIHTVRKDGSGTLPGSPFPLPTQLIESKIRKEGKNYTRFYLSLPDGVMEVHAASIHSTKDRNRQGQSYGLLMAGMMLDGKYAHELSTLTRSTVHLDEPHQPAAEVTTDLHQGIISFTRNLPGIDDQPIKSLAVQMMAPDIKHLVRQRDRNLLVGMGLLALLLLLIGFILVSWQRLKMVNLRLSSAQEAAKLGSWECNLAKESCIWSENLYQIYGLPVDTAPGLATMYALIHPDDRAQVKTTIEDAIKEGKHYEVEFRLIRPNGEIRHMRSQGDVDLDNVVRPHMTGYTQDVTELVQLTNELAEMNAQKDGLIAMLGHDLRTPLTPLTIMLPMIKDRADDEEIRKAVTICCKSVETLTKLVNKAQFMAGLYVPVTPERMVSIHLRETLEKVLADCQVTMTEKNVSCQTEIDPDVTIQGIPGQIHALVANLIENAIQFSQANGVIRVSAEQLDGKVTVSIRDDGIGLDSEHLERIFDEFFKVDTSRHDLHAHGLGLTICQRIIRNHHGRIWAESAGLGSGTTIRFTT